MVPSLLLATALVAGPTPDPAAEASRLRGCNLLRSCGLAVPPAQCPLSDRFEPPAEEDDGRCDDARMLNARGLTPGTPLGFRLYRFLGRRYRAVYLVEGELPISEPRLSFLIADLPLAARLLTRLTKTPYTASWVDPGRRIFRATRGSGLRGQAELVSGSVEERTLFYFGDGVSELGPWSLRGQSLVQADYSPLGPGTKRVLYRIRVVATPSNAAVNVVMNMGLFRGIVRRRIEEILRDIQEASRELERTRGAGILDSPEWSADEKQRVAAFLRLP